LLNSRTTAVAIAAVALVGAAVYAAVMLRGPASGAPPSSGDIPGRSLRMTLDPNLFTGSVREAYEIAGRNPALLDQLHCYCGCDKVNGHKSLLDCFRDSHGASCRICVGEAKEADVLSKQGISVEKIRDLLRERYDHPE